MKRHRFRPAIPEELWIQVFSYFSVVDVLDAYELLDPFKEQFPVKTLQENLSTKRAIALVNRHFHRLSMGFMFEILLINDSSHLHSLVKRMRNSSKLMKTIQHRTKRLEIVVAEQPNLSCLDPLDCGHPNPGEHTHHAHQNRKIFADVEIMIRACRSLKQLACCLPTAADDTNAMFLSGGINLNSTGLRFFSWRYAPLIQMSSLLPSLKDLRTLDLTATAMVRIDDGMDTPDMPFLHTIRGPLNIICPLFKNSCLPSLRTLIAFRYRAKAAASLTKFFDNHGSKLKLLALDNTCDVPDSPPLASCPNLEDLVVDWGHLSSMQHPMPSLVRLGLTFNHDKDLPPVLFILYNLKIFDNYLVNFPNLRTIQIVESRVSSHLLKHGPNALRLPLRQFRGHGIELRNEAGGILIE